MSVHNVDSYLRELDRDLRCSRRRRRAILDEVEAHLTEAAESGNGDFSRVVHRFGEPHLVAEGLNGLRQPRRVAAVTAAAGAVCTCLGLAAVLATSAQEPQRPDDPRRPTLEVPAIVVIEPGSGRLIHLIKPARTDPI